MPSLHRPARLPLPLATLAAAILLSACSAPDLTSATTRQPAARQEWISLAPGALSHDAYLRSRLESASAGLLYTSESDYPFTYVHGPTPDDGEISEGAIRDIYNLPDDVPVEFITLERFFARHIELVDPVDTASVAMIPRYLRLRETLRHSLPGLRVVRIGTVEIQCFVIGTDWQGHIAGLRTISIET